jgi:hypothetical protein
MKKSKEIVKETSSKYLSEEDIVKIIDEVLPAILKKRPELRKKLTELFDGGYATRGELIAILNEVKALREDMNRRFEAVDRRFEAVDRRFEAIDRKFEEMREDMNRRFEAMDKRFEEMREDMNRRFEAVDKRFEAMDKRFEAQRIDFRNSIEATIKALTSKIDTVGSRWGIMAEGSFRTALRELVAGLGYRVMKWRGRDDGRFFLSPRDVEIDVLVKNGKTIAVEVKSSLSMSEVDGFERTVRLYEESEGQKVDEKIILAVHAYPGVKEYASKLGIKIISEPEEINQ